MIRQNAGVFENNLSNLRKARNEISDLCLTGPGNKNFKP